MTNKTFKAFAVCILALLACLSLISAASLSISNLNTPSTIDHDDGSFQITFDLTNAGQDATIDWTQSTFSHGAIVSYSLNYIGDGSTTPVTESVTATVTYDSYQSGTITGTIIGDPSGSGSDVTEAITGILINPETSFTVSNPTTMSRTQETAVNSTFTITNDGNLAITPVVTIDPIEYKTGYSLAFDFSQPGAIQPGQSKEIEVDAVIPEDFPLDGESATVSVLVGSEEVTKALSITNPFCALAGNTGSLEMSDLDVEVKSGFGDEDKWYPLDEIKVTFDVDNEGSIDLDDVKIEICLLDVSEGKCIMDEDDMEINDEKFNLDEDDDTKEIEVTFTLNPKDLNKDNENYKLYVRAIGQIEGTTTDTCVSDSKSIDVTLENDFVIIGETKLTGTSYCGSTIQVTAEVYNIGKDKQEDISVVVTSPSLGISEKIIVGDISAMKKKEISFDIKLSTNLEEKLHDLEFAVYDEDDEIFENSDDDKAQIILPINVSGNCQRTADATVAVDENDVVIKGNKMELIATITNTGSSTETFALDIADSASWVDSHSIDPAQVVLDAGASEDVTIILDMNSGASGKNTFSILLEGEDGATSTQPVAVNVPGGFSLQSMFGENTYLWGIALVNVILIVIIIVVALKASKA